MASIGGGDPNIQAKVNGPALALMITAGLGILFAIYSIISNIISLMSPAVVVVQVQNQQLPKGMDMKTLQGYYQAGGAMGIIVGIIGLIVGGVIIFGAMKMRSLENYALAMTASILALIPCVSPCCCITLPFGIWALVVLMNAQVKASFH